MKNSIRQFIPEGSEESEKKVFDFDTLEELLEFDFVKSWKQDTEFYRYSTSENYGRYLLIAERDNGYQWWLIGYLKESVDLPEWKIKFSPKLPIERCHG